ncbi:LRP2-like protein [Mya arenaria]|uniref:LRP2-like protein n=1 Tax=Mya arenaria TaxID=6604 RepID=A0ABY7ELN5_MYAAR|nr:LRP2-like protein [Mya arenaria]
MVNRLDIVFVHTLSEDESNCTVAPCDEGFFTCHSGECVPDKVTCDHVLDCEDGSDENPECNYKDCTGAQFTCGNKKCIPKHWVCDKEDDCPDSSDEIPSLCDINECVDVAGTCSQGCVNTIGSYHCKCNPEYAKREDGRSCKKRDST